MDFSKVNKRDLITDLIKVACFQIVASVAMGLSYSEPILNEKFLYSLFFILLGFTTYHVVIAPRLLPLL